MEYMNEESLKKELDDRKQKISELLLEHDQAGAVTVKLSDGTKMVISEKAYRISCLNALLQPKGHEESFYSDEYNHGPYSKISSYTISHNEKTKPSLLDKIKMSKKVKEINKIKESNDPLLDKKGEVSIKLFPISHKENGGLVHSDLGVTDIEFLPDAMESLKVEITPRQLAMAGIDYKEVEWEEIKKIEQSNNNLDYLKVNVENGEISDTSGNNKYRENLDHERDD